MDHSRTDKPAVSAEVEVPQLPMFPQPPSLGHLLAVAEAMDFVLVVEGRIVTAASARVRLSALLGTRMLVTLDADGRGWTAADFDFAGLVLRMRAATSLH